VGVTILNALALLEARSEGASFERTLTLGRLAGFLSPKDLARIARALPPQSAFAKAVARGESPTFMDDLFRAMGACEVETLDVSAFEGASIVHDLNQPLPEALHGRFDAVVDGGTLEHVFNVPLAMKNAMDAVAAGGRFYASLPANNYCGHGFYQFSAEFFYRVFSAENGFTLEKLLVGRAWAHGRWLDGPAFDVSDPNLMRERVNIGGDGGLLFLVQARKDAAAPVFASWPQQSDYSAQWAEADVASAPTTRGAASALGQMTRKAGGAVRVLRRMHARGKWRRQSGANPALKAHEWRF
jgi:SAM-dependent methyltransferase